MTLPRFLIVGAMKAGTTTLYQDLQQSPAVFMPTDKEPNNLLHDDVLTPEGREAYAAHFRKARPEQLCGEASTGYTKLPDHPGVAARARALLGNDLRVIYLVREPISRIRSQHHHELSGGRIGCDIDEAVRRYPRFIDYSRYAMQAAPWIETLGRDRVLILRFESYVADRRGTVDRVCRFLGISPVGAQVRAEVVYNRSGGKPVREGPFERLRTTGVYRGLVRPMLSSQVRDSLRRLLLPRAPDRPQTPSPETVARIIEELSDDMECLRRIMGAPAPLWDLDRDAAAASRAAARNPTEHPG